MLTYEISRPTIVDDSGSGDDGTLFDNAFWNDDIFDAIDDVFADVATDVAALQEQGFLKGYDTVLYSYKNTSTVTIAADGQCTSDDGEVFYTISAAEDVDFTNNIANGESESASTLYYLWIGTNSSSQQEIVISINPTTVPNEHASATQLTHAHRLRGCVYNDGSSNLVAFEMTQDEVNYRQAAECGGSDPFEVLDATVSTTPTDVDCSAFIPAGTKVVTIAYCLSVAYPHFWRKNGDTHNGISCCSNSFRGWYNPVVDANGIFECVNGGSATTRISLIGFKI